MVDLTSPTEIKRIMDGLGRGFNKSLGQNFGRAGAGNIVLGVVGFGHFQNIYAHLRSLMITGIYRAVIKGQTVLAGAGRHKLGRQ